MRIDVFNANQFITIIAILNQFTQHHIIWMTYFALGLAPPPASLGDDITTRFNPTSNINTVIDKEIA